MDPSKRLYQDSPFEQSDLANTQTQEPAPLSNLSNVLRLIGPFEGLDAEAPHPRRPSAQEWSSLIERVRQAGSYTRQIEAQAQEQELRVQELLDHVREDMKRAAERVRETDARAAEIQARSEALLRAADERVRAAEERARIAEEWLMRVYETVSSEFTLEHASRAKV
jgi:small-conductance mechanosensitive channel